MNNDSISSGIRSGCHDIWNAFMVENAEFSLGSDMPLCSSKTINIPKNLISYVDAKHIHKENIIKNPDYHIDAYVHFYIDDQKFEGPKSGIWQYPEKTLDILRHFSGIITPDYSTFLDFPDPVKRYNTYRMRAFGYWIAQNGISVINNVRWGTEETWEYCFDGIPYNSIVAIGTVASKVRHLEYRPLFENGLKEMYRLLRPHTIIIYGSSNYSFFKELENIGVTIISFESDTSIGFSSTKRGDNNEQT